MSGDGIPVEVAEAIDTHQAEVRAATIELKAYHVVRGLGVLAASLLHQAEVAYESIEGMQLGETVAPEGSYVRVSAIHPEDPLDAEVFIAQQDDKVGWRRMTTDEYDTLALGRFGYDEHGLTTFFGKSMVYDVSQRKVFVYNADKNLRVAFRSKMNSGIEGVQTWEREIGRRAKQGK